MLQRLSAKEMTTLCVPVSALKKPTPQTFTKWMCISLILPKFGSDRTNKGLILKTFSIRAENFTLPREQVNRDIFLLHIQGLVLQTLLTFPGDQVQLPASPLVLLTCWTRDPWCKQVGKDLQNHQVQPIAKYHRAH